MVLHRDRSSSILAELDGSQYNTGNGSIRNNGKPQLMYYFRRSTYALNLAIMCYLLSWAPILCRVVRGMVKYPDEMPMAVWISTVGLLILYETFMLAQCNSIWVRFKMAARYVFESTHLFANEGQPIATIYDAGTRSDRFSFVMLAACGAHGWRGILSLAAGMTTGLISSVLYSIPSLRDLCGIPDKPSRAEPWAITSYLLLIWVIVLAFLEYGPTGVTGREFKVYLVVYLLISVGFLLGWGGMVVANLDNDDEAAMKWISLFLVIVVVIAVVWRGWRAVQDESSGNDDTIAADQQPARDRGTNDKLVFEFADWHTWAMWFHIGLALFVLLIGFAKSEGKWFEDYVLTHHDTYLFAGDWKTITDAKDQIKINGLNASAILPTTPSGQTRIDYCAVQEQPIGIYGIVLAALWSITSACQHRYSAGKCRPFIEPTDPNPETASEFSPWPLHKRARIFAVVVIVIFIAVYAPRKTIVGIVVTAVVAGPFVVWVAIVGPRRLYPPAYATEALDAILTIRSYRWIEYTLSATYMHVAVLSTMGILSSHEVVMTAGVFATSMILTHFVDSELSPIDRMLPVSLHIDTEKPFIFLSFFAKGVLTAAISVPFIFATNSEYQLYPSQCQTISLP